MERVRTWTMSTLGANDESRPSESQIISVLRISNALEECADCCPTELIAEHLVKHGTQAIQTFGLKKCYEFRAHHLYKLDELGVRRWVIPGLAEVLGRARWVENPETPRCRTRHGLFESLRD